jgi:hypothetical protein
MVLDSQLRSNSKLDEVSPRSTATRSSRIFPATDEVRGAAAFTALLEGDFDLSHLALPIRL